MSNQPDGITAMPAGEPSTAGIATNTAHAELLQATVNRLKRALINVQSVEEIARATLGCITTLLPESRTLILCVDDRDEGADVVAADVALQWPEQRLVFGPDSALHAALTATDNGPSTRFADWLSEMPSSAEVGPKRSLLTTFALPHVAPRAVAAVFHDRDRAAFVRATLDRLSSIVASLATETSPDPKIHAAVSKAKREWERAVDALEDIVLLLDNETEVLRANRAVERWGLGAVGDVRGRNVHEVLHPRCSNTSCRLQRMLRWRWNEMRAHGASSFDLFDDQLQKALSIAMQRIPQADGSPEADPNHGVVVVKDVTELRNAQHALQSLNDELELRVRQRTDELQATNRDLRDQVARRELAEQELQTSRDALAHLSSQLLCAQEDERRRIALELHDSVGQSLGALKYLLERFVALSQRLAPADAEKALDAAISQLQRAIHDTRTISMSLRPSLLDDMGGASAIRWLCGWFRETYADIQVVQNCDIDDASVPQHIAAPMFRIAQEALSNVAKHSYARKAEVVLRRVDNTVVIEIRDDGVGFDVATVTRLRPRLGIVGMRERAALTGGRFYLMSEPDVGTQIMAEWDVLH
jgi:signal transduction histidine kinase